MKNAPLSEREELVHTFGPPASSAELAEVEKFLGVELPDDLRNLLREFNGIVANDGLWEQQIYLSTQYMMSDVPEYIAESGNPMPPRKELDSVIFFAQQNGFAVLYAICVESFSSFKAGQVLSLDHETGEFELECNTLRKFADNWRYCLTS